ncbi:hypothetical protein BRD09_05625 [Halobacteriales archaeon SW_10_68_16]|nr:MAG: hypothetical protein BRD09_05625 [Halobacteriales archaeon SW_10_68_16]
MSDAPDGRTVELVRNVLALAVSSVLMVLVGFPIMTYGYASGLAALAGTVALVVGLVVAAGVALRSLDRLEAIARWLVGLWR